MCKHYTILYLRDSSASMFRAIATQTGHRLLSLHKKMKIIAKKIVWIAIITMICMCVELFIGSMLFSWKVIQL